VSQIVAATKIASNAKECILYQIYLAAFRKRKLYNDILTPRQAILYQEWLLSNRDRVKDMVSERRKRSPGTPKLSELYYIGKSDEEGKQYLTLEQLCKCLEETLKVSKNLLS